MRVTRSTGSAIVDDRATRDHRSTPPIVLISTSTLAAMAGLAVSARADIVRWDNGQLIPGTIGLVPAPGIDLSR